MTRRNRQSGDAAVKPKREGITSRKKAAPTSENETASSPEDLRRVFKDLEANQAMLEKQNVELRKTIAVLRENEIQTQCVIQGSPIPTFVINNDHKVIHWNKALEKISGISAGEVMGTRQHWRAFYEHERPCLADLLIRQDLEKIPRWYSGKYIPSALIPDAYEAIDFFPALGKSGKWLRFTAALIRDSYGNIVGAIETLEDVTAHKQAEFSLRESEQRYREIFNATSEAICIAEAPTGRILEVNEAMLSMYGYPGKEEALSLNIGDLSVNKAPYTEEAARKRLQAAVDGEPQQFEWLSKRKDKTIFPVEVTLRRSHIGGHDRVIAVVRDITNRHRV